MCIELIFDYASKGRKVGGVIRDGLAMKKVKEMPVFNRPREKLQEKGRKGVIGQENYWRFSWAAAHHTQDVMTLAERVLKVLDDTSANPTIEQLQSIDGIGPAKATTILAALEFARRRIRPEGI